MSKEETFKINFVPDKKPFPWLKFWNIFLFQWLCVRIVSCRNKKPEDIEWYSVLIFVAPLTGWSDPFLFVFGIKTFIKIPYTERKCISNPA